MGKTFSKKPDQETETKTYPEIVADMSTQVENPLDLEVTSNYLSSFFNAYVIEVLPNMREVFTKIINEYKEGLEAKNKEEIETLQREMEINQQTDIQAIIKGDYTRTLEFEAIYRVLRRRLYTLQEQKGWCNTPRTCLVNRLLYEAPMEDDYKLISGPVTCTHLYSSRWKKNIYLFGDKHTTESCAKRGTTDFFGFGGKLIEEFMYQMMNHSAAFIDFFIEYSSGQVHEKESQAEDWDIPEHYWPRTKLFMRFRLGGTDNLNILRHIFYSCVNKDKEGCQYLKTARVHWGDVRWFSKKNPTKVLDVFSWLTSSGAVSPDKRTQYVLDNIIPKWPWLSHENYQAGADRSKVKDYFFEALLDNEHITKELKRSVIKKEIEDYYSILLEEILQVLYVMATREYNPEVYAATLCHVAFKINSLRHDIYQLARMFKMFHTTAQYPSTARNIICYNGARHTRDIVWFLKGIGFRILEKADDGNGKPTDLDELEEFATPGCIDISKMKQPFFSDIPKEDIFIQD